MNETDVRIKEDANDLVYDPNQEAAQPVAATAPAVENPHYKRCNNQIDKKCRQ